MNSVKLQDTGLICRNLLLFYTPIKNYQKEKVIPFKIISQRIKYLGINLIKMVKDLYSENNKTLMKEIEDDQINGKISRALGLEELILLKWPYYSKQSMDLM